MDNEFPSLTAKRHARKTANGEEEDNDSTSHHLSYAHAAAQGASHSPQNDSRNQHRQHDQHVHGGYFHVTPEQQQYFRRPHQEQDYDTGIANTDLDVEPTRDELEDLAAACSRLWTLDTNRLVPGEQIKLNLQGGKRVYGKDDVADNALFQFVDHQALQKPTFARFYALLDNYSADQDLEEYESQQERGEQRAFIEEIYQTAPIKYVHKYLSHSGLVPRESSTFKSQLSSLWFRLCNRGGTRGSSSAFEHVFVGEVKENRNREEVSGFHNWLHFYSQEAKGAVDYQGFIVPRNRNSDMPDEETQLLTIQFEWHDILKQCSSIFIGTSPEFEIALYTLCYFAGKENNYLELGSHQVNVKVYRIGNGNLGAAFTTVED